MEALGGRGDQITGVAAPSGPIVTRPANLLRQASFPLTLASFIAGLIALRDWVPGIERPPEILLIHLEAPLNVAIRSVAEWAQPFFRFLSWLFAIPIDWLRAGLGFLPWFVFVTLTALIAHAAGGVRLALFTATAFLHSVMVQERRGMLRVWNVTLVILTFFLTIVGTFMTRSGVVESVHAFGKDAELTRLFSMFMAAIVPSG